MEGNNITGIIMATYIEARPFIKGMGLILKEKKPFKVYSGKGFYLIISGIGKANAAMAASYIILKYKASIIINCGAAGSTSMDFKIGDILHIKKVIETDRPKIPGNLLRSFKPDLLKGFKTAILATRDRAVLDKREREIFSRSAQLLDMEGAAIVQASKLFNIRCYLFKIVTDNPEKNKSKDIIYNIIQTRTFLFNFFRERIFKIFHSGK